MANDGALTVIVSAVEPDGDLVDRMAASDDDALSEVFDRYAGFLLGVARRVYDKAGVAEDVVQEVLTSLWRNPERFDPGRGTLRAYLGVQAHRRALDALRQDTRRSAREAQYGLLDGKARFDTAMADATALAEAVRHAIARLPDSQRRAVELAFWGGRTYREVADALGIPEGTAKSRLRLAQSKLVDWLRPLAMETR